MRTPAPEDLIVLENVCRHLRPTAAERILAMPRTSFTPFIEAYVLVHDDDTCPPHLREQLAAVLVEALDGGLPR